MSRSRIFRFSVRQQAPDFLRAAFYSHHQVTPSIVAINLSVLLFVPLVRVQYVIKSRTADWELAATDHHVNLAPPHFRFSKVLCYSRESFLERPPCEFLLFARVNPNVLPRICQESREQAFGEEVLVSSAPKVNICVCDRVFVRTPVPRLD